MTEIKYGASMLDFELPKETLEKYYNKLVPFKVEGKRTFVIKDELTRHLAYLWRTNEASSKDQIDEDFLSEKVDAHLIETMAAIGVHSCAFRGCFKPDIVEVCNLLSLHLEVDKLDQIDRIYVTTVPYPDNSVECILRDGSGHYGKTTFYMVYNNKIESNQVTN